MNGTIQCSICLKTFKSLHGLKTHKGMSHKSKRDKKQRRKMQLIQAASNYNVSIKGKQRSKKYEQSSKAFKRRQRYRHSPKGIETDQRYKTQQKQKKQEKQRQEREMNERFWREKKRKDIEEEGKLFCQMLRNRGMTHFLSEDEGYVCLYPNDCKDSKCPNSIEYHAFMANRKKLGQMRGENAKKTHESVETEMEFMEGMKIIGKHYPKGINLEYFWKPQEQLGSAIHKVMLIKIGKNSCTNLWKMYVKDENGHFEAIDLKSVFIKLPRSFKGGSEPMHLDEN